MIHLTGDLGNSYIDLSFMHPSVLERVLAGTFPLSAKWKHVHWGYIFFLRHSFWFAFGRTEFVFLLFWGFFVLVYTCSLSRFTSISLFWEGKTGYLGNEREKSQGKSSEKKQQHWDIAPVWKKHIDAHQTSVPLLITKFSISTIKVSLWPRILVLSESHLLFSLFHDHRRSWVSYDSARPTVPPKPHSLSGWDPEHQAGWVPDITWHPGHMRGVVAHGKHLI